MRRIVFLLGALLLLFGGQTAAQVSISPAFATADDTLNIIFDRTGTGLSATSAISIHMGAVTESPCGTAWTNVPMTWGDPAARWQMQAIPGEPNKFRYRLVNASLQPVTVRQFFNIPAGTPIYRLGIVFRSTGPCGGFGGSSTVCAEGKAPGNQDFYVSLATSPGLQVRLAQPCSPKSVLLASGATLNLRAEASQAADLRIFNGATELASTASGTSLTFNFSPASGTSGLLRAVATVGATTVSDTIGFAVRGTEPTAANPPGTIRDGVNYISSTSVILQLRLTADKQYAYALGDFNDWRYDNAYRLRRRADDNTRFWIQIDGLTAGQQYRFQYDVDGLRVTDPYAELVLHSNFDQFISATTYPNRPQYPTGKTTGTVGVLQPGRPSFPWTDGSWQTPTDPRGLNVYELWVYDFTEKRSFQGVIDSLDYLQRLGVSVIELMPVQEFDGNISWGYNPTYNMAVDKAYGTREKLKELVDKAHARGIAVVLDVVFNQTHEANPIAQLWWDQTNFRPAANNPYLNVTARHPFNVFFDFNHESSYTRDYVVQVCRYWMDEFHIDGFRFDLSKGFTQTQTSDVNAWNNYDASRVANWTFYRNALRATHPRSMLILEHLGGDQEEAELAGLGFWLWGIMHFQYKEVALGFSQDVSRVWHANRGFPNHHLIGYMESHDEERIAVDLVNFAATSTEANSFYRTAYNPRTNRSLRMDRQKLAAAFLYPVPGPKMLWQFGEFGYDFSINRCEDGTINNSCRLSPKPLGWGYITPGATGAVSFDTNRVKMRDFHAALLNLRQNHAAFREGNIDGSSLGGLQKRLRINHATMNVVILGNFSTDTANIDPNFPAAGTYYDYFRRDTRVVAAGQLNASITLAPGELRFFTSVELPSPRLRLVPYAVAINLPPPSVTLAQPADVCLAATATVGVTVSSPYNAGNVFTVQLSDASGSFAAPVNVGTATATTATQLSFTIPAGTAPNTGYRLRVVSSSPATTSAASPAFAVLAVPGTPAIAGSATRSICPGAAATLGVSGPPAGATYRWNYTPAGSTVSAVVAGQTGATLEATLPGAYTVQLVAPGTCPNSLPSAAVTVTLDNSGQPSVSRNGSVLNATGGQSGTYQWYVEASLNGTIISGPIFGATGSNYTLLANGRYRVAVTTGAGCRWFSGFLDVTGLPNTASFVPQDDGTIKIEPLSLELRLVPNPAQGQVTVEWPYPDPVQRAELFNMAGTQVRVWQVTGTQGIVLPLSGLPSGMYLLRLHTQSQTVTQRLLIQD